MFDYSAPSNALAERIIVVTGAGDGIGRAAAMSYAALGATVILVGRTLNKLEAVYDAIVEQGSPTPAIYPCDLSRATEQDYDTMATTLEDEFGHLDGLLHNASLLGDRTPISQYEADTWQQVMQVNVNAGFMMTQALLPLLEASADASIIFTSSSVGNKGKAYWGAYSVSKFATEGMAQILAAELENISNIRVNTINPGATRTNMRAKAYPGEDPVVNFTPEEIMPVYHYLMGADSKGVTGQRFNAQAAGGPQG